MITFVARWRRLSQHQELIGAHRHLAGDTRGVDDVRFVLPFHQLGVEESRCAMHDVSLATVTHNVDMARFDHRVVQRGLRITFFEVRIRDHRVEAATLVFLIPAIATAFGTAHRPADLVDDVAFFAQTHDDAAAGVGVQGKVVQVRSCDEIEAHGKLLSCGGVEEMEQLVNSTPF